MPLSPAQVTEACEKLHKAMKGFGCDEKAIIAVLAPLASDEILQIVHSYKGSYGDDLIKKLKSELKGNFENVTIMLCTPLPILDAEVIHDAIAGLGTDEALLVE
ncbi:Annexin A6, partial [Kappamyces sp. JEL0680]